MGKRGYRIIRKGRFGFGVDVIELSVNTRKITACTLKQILERERRE